jgi:hypothetical protein
MPISENTVRYIRRVASPTLASAPTPDAAEIIVDASTNTLKFHSAGAKEVMDLSNTQTVTGNKTFSGSTGVRVPVSVTATAAVTVTAADTGTVYICTASSGTQVFTLPAASTAGLTYTFTAGAGSANGEIRVGVATGDNILGKIHAAQDGTALVTTATTGLLLNTASGNVAGDSVTLVADGITTWYMSAVIGAWSAG